jgi:ribosomal-protein-alanine N-acetyltransferase
VRVLETRRTLLRPFAGNDADALLEVFRDAGVRHYLLDDSVVPASWVADEIAASTARFARDGTGLWTIRLHGAASIVGFAGFREFFEPPQLQLLYGLLPVQWGRGLATEVAARVCEHGFRDLALDPIRAAIDVPNRASAAVLGRLGFVEIRRSDDGATAFYALGRADWERAAAFSG